MIKMNLRLSLTRLKYIFNLALLIGCCAVLSCRPSPECRAFYDLSHQDRESKIRNSSIEEQINLYRCGMYQEPPDDFSDGIADGGVKIIPYLLDRLRAEKSETFQDDLIHIFEKMAVKGYLHGRRDIIEQLKPIVSGMKNDSIKGSAQKRLGVIENNL